MRKYINIIATALTLTLMASCERSDDFVAPSFLHIDAIKVGPAPEGDIAHGDYNFYTSNIVGAYVVAHYPGEMKVDTIGLFTTPFTAPILHSGNVDYIDIYPAVKVSGSSGEVTFYTFYDRLRISDTVLASGDTLDFDTLTTSYNTLTDAPKLFEPFEPTEGGVATDSVVEWVRHDRENACSGEGYGRVHVTADQTSVPFGIDKIGSNNYFIFPSPIKAYYMELDIRSELEVKVWMHASYSEGGVEEKLSVMNINPTNGEWRHLYIMLGRTWNAFNKPTKVRLSFSALNLDGIEGDVLIDNIKVLSTGVVF